MHRFTKILLAITMLSTPSLLASSRHSRERVSVCGGGTYASVNDINDSFTLAVAQWDILAEGNHIERGTFTVSSQEAAPVDPVNDIDFESTDTVDAVRVFADHPDIVWVHGIASGFIRFGTSAAFAPFSGQTVAFTPTSGESICAVSTFGRTNCLSVFENGGPFPINFFTATEEQLISLVGGFSRLLLTNGAKPGEVCIETEGRGDITIPNAFINTSLNDI